MNIDLKSQFLELYRSLSWRRMARDRIGSKVLRIWSPVWGSVSEIYHQMDIPGIALNAHGLAVGFWHDAHDIVKNLGRIRNIRPRAVGGALIALGMVFTLVRSLRSNHDAAPASAARLRSPDAATKVTIAPTPSPASIPAPVVDETTRLETEYAAAKMRCMDRLYATEAYKSAKTEVDRLDALVRQLRKGDPERQLPAVSQEWIAAKSIVSRMTDAALSEDSAVQRTQQALLERGVLRRGRRIYVFESGQPRSSDGTSPSVSANDSDGGP